MRLLRAAAAFLLVATWCGSAEAQLPLPQLEETPDVRFATGDAFLDEVRNFGQRMEKQTSLRKTANDASRASIKERLERYRRTQKSPDPIEVADDFDPLVAQRLLEAYDKENELLQRTVELANEAIRASQAKDDGRALSFDDVVELELRVQRGQLQANAAAERLARLEAIGRPEVRPSGTDVLEELLLEQEARIQGAQFDHATAVDYELHARTAAMRRKFDAGIGRLEVSAAQAASAAERFAREGKSAAKEREALQQERAKLREAIAKAPKRIRGVNAETARAIREAQRDLLLAQSDLIAKKEVLIESKLALAEARQIAMKAAQAEQPAIWPGRLTTGRLMTRIAAVTNQIDELEAQRTALRRGASPADASQLRAVSDARRVVLDEAAGVLLDTKRQLEMTRVARDLGDQKLKRLSARPSFWISSLLTALVLLAALALITIVLRNLHRIVALLPLKKFKEDAKFTQRIELAFSLVWPGVILILGAVLIIWPIWRSDVTVLDAIKAVDRPLFFVDETEVSVFSLIKLTFAIWAAVVASRALREFLSARIYRRLEWDIGLTNAANTLVHYLVILIGAMVGLRFVGIGLSSLAIFAGILGIGIGFGLRNITENFISGLIILAERPIKIGDYVEVTGSVEGEVRYISARSTTVVTRDNVSLIIPNSEFVGAKVINWSHGDPKVRTHVSVGVAYGSDTDLVRKTLLECATRHGKVLKKPPPEVMFKSFGDSSLVFNLHVWIDEQQHRIRILSDLHFAVDKAFRKMGIEIAFPQLDLHVRTLVRGASEAIVEPAPLPDTSRPLAIPDAETVIDGPGASGLRRRRSRPGVPEEGGE